MNARKLAPILTAATLAATPALAESNTLQLEPLGGDKTQSPVESTEPAYEVFQFDMSAGNPIKNQIEGMCHSSETVHLTHQFPQMADPVVIAANCDEFKYSGVAYVAYDIENMPSFLKLDQ